MLAEVAHQRVGKLAITIEAFGKQLAAEAG